MRLLVVTIAGTLIANILTVMVAALSVVILRSWNSPSSSNAWGVFGTVVFIVILGSALTAPAVPWCQEEGASGSSPSRRGS
jgi:hypothetical protein